MTPSWWQFTLLSLAAYRITRLIGWDDLPPIRKLRERAIGEQWIPTAHLYAILPPDAPETTVVYHRPLLAHFVHCPFCVGFWASVAAYLSWLWEPRDTTYAAVPLALSAVVGLVSKNLDA